MSEKIGIFFISVLFFFGDIQYSMLPRQQMKKKKVRTEDS